MSISSLLLSGVGGATAAASTNTHSLDLESTSSQYVTRAIAGSTGLGITGSFTLECWVKPESLSADGTIMGITNRSGSGGGYFMRYVNGTNVLDCKYINSGTDITLQKSAPFTAGVWTHAAFVHDSTANIDYIYLNGVEATNATGRTSDPTAEATLPFRVGSRSDAASDFYDGLVDEVRVWNVARTAAEISGNYQTELTGSESGLVLYYKLNNNYNDSTANANNGTAVNAPVFSTTVPF